MLSTGNCFFIHSLLIFHLISIHGITSFLSQPILRNAMKFHKEDFNPTKWKCIMDDGCGDLDNSDGVSIKFLITQDNRLMLSWSNLNKDSGLIGFELQYMFAKTNIFLKKNNFEEHALKIKLDKELGEYFLDNIDFDYYCFVRVIKVWGDSFNGLKKTNNCPYSLLNINLRDYSEFDSKYQANNDISFIVEQTRAHMRFTIQSLIGQNGSFAITWLSLRQYPAEVIRNEVNGHELLSNSYFFPDDEYQVCVSKINALKETSFWNCRTITLFPSEHSLNKPYNYTYQSINCELENVCRLEVRGTNKHVLRFIWEDINLDGTLNDKVTYNVSYIKIHPGFNNFTHSIILNGTTNTHIEIKHYFPEIMYYFKVDRTSYNKTAFGKWFGYKTPKAHFVIPIDDIDPPMGVSYKVVEPGQVAISWKSVKEYEGYTGYAIEVYCKSYNRTFFIRKLYDDSHMLENVDFRYPVSFTIAMQNNFIVSKRKSNKLSIKPLLDIEGFALNPSPVFSQRTLTTFLFIAITIIVVSVFSYIFYKLHYWRSKKGRVCIQNGIVDYNRFNYGRNPENYVRPDNDFEIRMAAIKQLIDEGHIMG